MTRFHRERWGTLRVAGVSADRLAALRFEETPRALEALLQAEAAAAALRPPLVDALHAAVSRIEDPYSESGRALRAVLLEVKRRVFNARPIALDAAAQGAIPGELAPALQELAAAEARAGALASAYEETLRAEQQRVHARVRELAALPALAHGLLLSSADLADAAARLAATEAPLSRREERRLSAIGTYLFRAITRTTPFSSFASVALIREGESTAEDETSGASLSSVVQLHAGLLAEWTRNALERSRDRVPLRVTPLRGARGAELVFPRPRLASDGQLELEWFAVPRQPELEAVIGAGDRSAVELARASSLPEEKIRAALASLVELGFLRPVHPRPAGSPAALRGLAASLAGYAIDTQPLALAADLLDAYPAAPIPERRRILGRVRALFLADDGAAPIYEDVRLELGGGASPLPATIAEDLAPALHLAASSVTNAPHYLLCEAFVRRYGLGPCEDVGAFLVELLQEEGFVARVRFAQPPPAWLDSPLRAIVEHADAPDAIDSCPRGGRTCSAADRVTPDAIDSRPRGSRTCSDAHRVRPDSRSRLGEGEPPVDASRSRPVLRLDPALFASLPRSGDPFSVALFVQLDGERVVLDEVQAGRHKYLSRFLLGEGGTAARAERELREELAASDPLPVGLSPSLGLSFQMHPPLCAYELELPDEAAAGVRTLPLSDLTLRFDPGARRLRMFSRSLAREIELLHLGFLRDCNLPDPLLLLRALSPSYRDDLLAERTALYRTLDALALASGRDLPPFRPRLEVGRLVLERARWAMPVAEVPVPSADEGLAAYYRRVHGWRRARGLPERAMVQRFSALPAEDAASTPLYADFDSPLTLTGMAQLVRSGEGTNAWLILREVLPAPEDASLCLEGRRHVAQHMIQFRGE